MTWAFRVDTNKNAGGGHTSRSICLANQINKHKKVVFFVNCKNDKLSTKIIDSGYKVDVVDNFDQYNFYGCIFDGYKFEKKEISFIRTKIQKMVQIYDFGTIHDEVDLIISSNTNSFLRNYKKKKKIGLEFTLIKPEFQNKNRIINKTVKNIFISFGLSDSKNLTLKVLEIIKDSKLDLRFENIYLAINSKSEFIDRIQKIKEKMVCNLIVKEFGTELNEILKKSDLSIGSGGVGMCERLCSGIPSVVIVTSENQEEIVEKVNEEKAIIKCGSLGKFDKNIFLKSLINILDNFHQRKLMSELSRKIIDGNGSIRVSKEIITL